MKTVSSLIISVLLSTSAWASKVAIVDTGTFFDHQIFSGKIWNNPYEVLNNIDDDNNAKIDDIVGWNFASLNNQVFYPEHMSLIHPIIYKVFEILGRMELGTLTPDDRKFWNEKVIALPDEQKGQLIEQLNFYGAYAHGTHCSGVVALGNPQALIMSARVFENEEAPAPHEPFLKIFDAMTTETPVEAKESDHEYFARESNKDFVDVANYLAETQMDVANYSLGIPLAAIAERYLIWKGNQNPTEEEIIQETWNFYRAFEVYGQQWIALSSNTLFVVAAGNDGTDNDKLPMFPANVNAPNKISVAASKLYSSLADFSNYGKTSVDVAAPGVAVQSAVPSLDKNMYLPMSGTSMSAPYVAMVASNIKDRNPSLSPADIKRILMETVDKKSWLKNRVVAEGVVNHNRAYAAADLTLEHSLNEAISLSLSQVQDIPETEPMMKSNVQISVPEWAKKLVF